MSLIHKLLFGVFALFLIFVAIVFLIGDYQKNPLFSIFIFIFIIYVVYYLAIKIFFKEL